MHLCGGQRAALDIGCHEEQQDQDGKEPPGAHLQEPAAAHHTCFPGCVSKPASCLVTQQAARVGPGTTLCKSPRPAQRMSFNGPARGPCTHTCLL